jgi:hypothetical protein
MFWINSLKHALLATCAAVALAPPLAIAQDRDSQEIASYALTEAGLAKYTQATKNMAALAAGAQPDCSEEDDSNGQSIDQTVAKFNAVPGAKAAIQSAGMTTREYVVFTFSLFHNGLAAWALTQPGGKLPSGTSKANVDFYNNHAAQLQGLEEFQKDDECDEPADEEAYEEE